MSSSTGVKEYSGQSLYASASRLPRSWGFGGGRTTDGLTGLLERGCWDKRAEEVLDGPAHRPVALLLLDFDRFKAVNDAYGRQAGDAVLRTMAGIVTDAMRVTDLAGRFDRARSDRFLILLPAAGSEYGLTAARRIRTGVRAATVGIHSPSGHPVLLTGLTASIGVAVRDAGEDLSELLRQARAAVGRAKSSGRDRVALADAVVAP